MSTTRAGRGCGARARRLLAIVVVPLLATGLLNLLWGPAQAATPVTSAIRSEDGGSSPASSESSGNCVAYANGTSMGSFCATSGGDALGTLRQRFSGQEFRECRYKPTPKGLFVPHNPNPDKGRWMMQICMRHINWDTVFGGTNKQLSMQQVWMPFSADTEYEDPTGLEKWLWDIIASEDQFPRPYLRAKPNYVPLVGLPAYFEFTWLDPETIKSGRKQVVADPNGPYADLKSGGPFLQSRNGDLVMQASAANVTIDPMQKDMRPVDCKKGVLFYDETKPPSTKAQSSSCHLTFKRSSSAADAKATHPIPEEVGDVYYLKVTVDWKVKYGKDANHLDELGDGFTMVSYQPMPVQEIQAPNIPPVMIF